MCGRIANTLPKDAMVRLFEATPGNDLPEGARHNLCPTEPLAVCISTSGVRHLQAMRWGFVPHWYKSPSDGPLLINARAETVAQKPAFRAAIRTRRYLIPADGFYEWHRAGEARLPLRSCAIVTLAAGPVLAPIHHREPLILERADWAKWLGEAGHGAARLMVPRPEQVLQAWRVGRAVNSSRAEGETLRAPLVEAG